MSAIFDGMRRVAITTAGLGSNRLELLGIEMQEELERQTGNLVWLLAAFVLGGLALLLVSILLLIVLWDTQRVAVAVGLALLYSVLSFVCVQVLRRRMRDAPTPFALTAEEFKRDRAALQGRAGETP
ncbi:MAG: phage holin family protein [Formivibrio sp.]|nr:phage holin family protein [Formivibrio sp.]